MSILSSIFQTFSIPNTKPFKDEKSFTTWYLGEIRKDNGFAHKISDMDRGLKPCDAIVAYKGHSAIIEFKYTKHSTCYPYYMLRGSSPQKPGAQVKGLTLCSENGGNSLVIVYSAKKNAYKVLDFKELPLDTKISFDG